MEFPSLAFKNTFLWTGITASFLIKFPNSPSGADAYCQWSKRQWVFQDKNSHATQQGSQLDINHYCVFFGIFAIPVDWASCNPVWGLPLSGALIQPQPRSLRLHAESRSLLFFFNDLAFSSSAAAVTISIITKVMSNLRAASYLWASLKHRRACDSEVCCPCI